jgi:hypothetical protein
MKGHNMVNPKSIMKRCGIVEQYDIITHTENTNLNNNGNFNDSNNIKSPKRVTFHNDVLCHIYTYKKVNVYKQSLDFCVKQMSKVFGTLSSIDIRKSKT